jgi:hypothetical protein
MYSGALESCIQWQKFSSLLLQRVQMLYIGNEQHHCGTVLQDWQQQGWQQLWLLLSVMRNIAGYFLLFCGFLRRPCCLSVQSGIGVSSIHIDSHCLCTRSDQ